MEYLTAHELELCEQARMMCACNQLRRASRTITQHYDTVLAAHGLKVTQLPILIALGLGGDLPVTSLADLLALDRTTLTRNLKVLARRGLVQYPDHNGDARVRLVGLSLEGSRVLSQTLEQWTAVQTDVETRFDFERLRVLYGELRALTEAIVETRTPVAVA